MDFLVYFIALIGGYCIFQWLLGYSIELIFRAPKLLLTAADKLPPNVASHGAVWGGLAGGVVLLACTLALFFGAMRLMYADPPQNYGSVNGRAISKADYDACGGKIPDGCPGGLAYLVRKYHRPSN